jgi:hypothetical protein
MREKSAVVLTTMSGSAMLALLLAESMKGGAAVKAMHHSSVCACLFCMHLPITQ